MKDKNKGLPAAKWLRIGPGLLIAAGLSVVVWNQWGKYETAVRQTKPRLPIIERHIISSSIEAEAGPIPELQFILDRGESLKLNRSQREHINKLQQDWLRRYAPKLAAAQHAADATSEYLQHKQVSSRVPIEQIHNNAAPLISLSAEISAARRTYWQNATRILSGAQRDTLYKARVANWLARKKRMLQMTHPK